MIIDAMVTSRELEILLHHHKVEFERWSDEEPEEKRRAKFALRYWECVQSGDVRAERAL